MNFKDQLRAFVLLPKIGTELKVTDYNYPENEIAFLNMIRDYYTKYHTTFPLFFPSDANNALLVDGGSVESLEKAVSFFREQMPSAIPYTKPMTPFRLCNYLDNSLGMFLFITTMGHSTSSQVMSSIFGKRFILPEPNNQAVLNRVSSLSSISIVVVAGVNTIVLIPPSWWSDLNGTNVLSLTTVPSGADIISIINDVLTEAYAYYALPPVSPTFQNEPISLVIPSNYWITTIANKISNSKVSTIYLEGVFVRTFYVNFYKVSGPSREINSYSENGTGSLKDISTPSPISSINTTFEGLMPIPFNYISSFNINDEFVSSFQAIFGDWFDIKDFDVIDSLPDFISDPTLDPFLTSESNQGSGSYFSRSANAIIGNVNYFLKDNYLIIVNGSTNTVMPLSLWKYSNTKIRSIIFIALSTHKEKIIINKNTRVPIDGTNIASVTGLANGTSLSWLLNLLVKSRLIAKNTWLNQNVPISPYVKIFTSGKVTLQYLISIQVRDTILKSENGKDLFLFPAFLIYEQKLLTPDPYVPLNYRVDSVLIKSQLASAILYIQTQLFAQDIATLNTISARFDQSIMVNDTAKQKLDSELLKVTLLSNALTTKLLEAKKLFLTLDILKANLATMPDPVLAYTQQVQSKIDSELSAFTASEKIRLVAVQQAQLATDKLNADLALEEARRLVDIVEAKRLYDVAEQQRLAVIAEHNRLQVIAEAQKQYDLIAEQLALSISANEKQAVIDEAVKVQALVASTQSSISSKAEINVQTNYTNTTNVAIEENRIAPSVVVSSAITSTSPVPKSKAKVIVPVVAGLGVVAWLALGQQN